MKLEYASVKGNTSVRSKKNQGMKV